MVKKAPRRPVNRPAPSAITENAAVPPADVPGDITDATATEIAERLTALPQVVAAWLVGVSPRTLRDRISVPRNSNGTYDARALLQWELTHCSAARLNDQQREACWLIGSMLTEALCPVLGALHQLLHTLGGGPDARAAVLAMLIDYAEIEIEVSGEHLPNRPPSINLVLVCAQCGKMRTGSRWTEETPPAGVTVDDHQKCPKCSPRGWQATLQQSLGSA